MSGMTAHELQAWLRSQFPKEDERNEWKGWLILQHIQKFKSVPAPEIRDLFLDKLPDSLSATQKQAKIKNLLAALRVTGLDGLRITTTGSGKGARWEIVRP